MISRLQVATVYVSDLERAMEFYVDVLGFDLVADWRGDDGDRMVFTLPPGGGSEIGLYSPEPGDPRIGTASGLVFTADDIRETVAELRSRGVVFTRELVMHDYGDGDRPGDEGDLEAEFADPDGNRLTLHS